ncbi:MAG: hypothetical protein WC614_01445 [bacterium]
MLIYSRITNKSHTRTSLYLWLPSILMGSLALKWYDLALVLVGIFALYIISYASFYNNIVKFKFKKQKNR